MTHLDDSNISRVLELGCGEGHLCRLLSRQGFQVMGVDISDIAIAWAQQKNKQYRTHVDYLSADLTDAALNLNRKFDLIVDGNCLHCITGDSRRVFLANAIKHLNDHGTLFISSLCSKDETNHLIEQYDLNYRFIPGPQFLLAELQHNGFTIIAKHIYQRKKHNHINIWLSKSPVL